jgi:hypothetical protein
MRLSLQVLAQLELWRRLIDYDQKIKEPYQARAVAEKAHAEYAGPIGQPVGSELSCPVLVAHHMSASSGSVLLWACGRGEASSTCPQARPPSGFKRREGSA